MRHDDSVQEPLQELPRLEHRHTDDAALLAAEHELERAKQTVRAQAQARVQSMALELQVRADEVRSAAAQTRARRQRLLHRLLLAGLLLAGLQGVMWWQHAQAQERLSGARSELRGTLEETRGIRAEIAEAEGELQRRDALIDNAASELRALEYRLDAWQYATPESAITPAANTVPAGSGTVQIREDCLHNPLC